MGIRMCARHIPSSRPIRALPDKHACRNVQSSLADPFTGGKLGSRLIKPSQGGSETHGSEIIACQSVIAGCDTSEVLQPIESGLDAPAQLVEACAEAKRLLPV